MTSVNVFWLLTIACCGLALTFVMPPLWIASRSVVAVNSTIISKGKIVSLLLAVLLCCAAYKIYLHFGAGPHLPTYYSQFETTQRRNNAQLRPLYAKLQRELLKVKIGQSVDLANITLIIQFAGIHSKLGDGLLPNDIKTLLQNVVKTDPRQIMAWNLLAVDSYKSRNYAAAIECWQKILLEIPVELQNSADLRVIKDKIAATRLLVSAQTQ